MRSVAFEAQRRRPAPNQVLQNGPRKSGVRALPCRTGLAELRDERRLQRLREGLIRGGDDCSPDWPAIGRPVAALLDTIDLQHPNPKPAPAPGRAPGLAEMELVIRKCGGHLLRSFARCGFIPPYSPFNLTREPTIRGRQFAGATHR